MNRFFSISIICLSSFVLAYIVPDSSKRDPISPFVANSGEIAIDY